MKDAFSRLIRAADKARCIDKELSGIGYTENIYADIFGDIVDAVYLMLGENTDRLENSFAYVMLNADAVSADGRATMLAERFSKSVMSA